MLQYLLKQLCLVFVLMVLAMAAQAQTVEAEGSAPIDGPVGVAKRLALQDAIRQALIQSSATVSTTTVMSLRGVVSDNVRFTARGRVTGVVVLDEWSDEGNYYVRIRAQVPGGGGVASASLTPGLLSPSRAEAISTFSGLEYRRKLAVTQFHVLDRTQISDLPDIEISLARELKRRLDNTGKVRTVDASQYLVPLAGQDLMSQRRILGALPPATDAGQVATEFAESLGVQFIVTGVIRDMGTTKHLLGMRIRHLELDLTVHDGITGEEVARHRINESVETIGVFDAPITTPVLNDKFYASPLGQKVDRVLNKLVSMLVNDLDTQPFAARVLRTEGNKVFFDAGGTANVKVGDVLSTYRLASAFLNDLSGQRSLGTPERASATLIVTQVQRLFSVGELDSETARLSPGDVIRFEP
ncbi:MAG: hypothetical protein GXP17_02270 [Gammaproteobacteria bacterium]|nr:hypothetical protein [Gammaproteobacteria bacterium]